MPRRFLALLIPLLTCLVILNQDACGQQVKKPGLPGLKLGSMAPDFRLKDHNQRDVSLKKLLASGKNVALVFHRSADW